MLGEIRGSVFGGCTDCGPGEWMGSPSLEEVLRDHIAPLSIPVEVEADARTIQMLEPGVS